MFLPADLNQQPPDGRRFLFHHCQELSALRTHCVHTAANGCESSIRFAGISEYVLHGVSKLNTARDNTRPSLVLRNCTHQSTPKAAQVRRELRTLRTEINYLKGLDCIYKTRCSWRMVAVIDTVCQTVNSPSRRRTGSNRSSPNCCSRLAALDIRCWRSPT